MNDSLILRQNNRPHRVVIIGGGFAGLKAARALRKAPVEVVLIDKRNFHLFQPLLYQVATGSLSPANISAPLRSILSHQKNCRCIMGNVTGVDPDNKMVIMDGGQIYYDSLIVAAGASHSYFGHNEWEEVAPGLKTIEDATEIRARIYSAFEFAERESDPADTAEWLNFVIVGAGPTGVELAGAVAEIARNSLKHDFRRISSTHAKIYLVEAGPKVLGMYTDDLSQSALKQLQKIGVIVRLNTMVTDITRSYVTLKHDGQEDRMPTRTVLWAAGVQASPLGRLLAEKTGAKVDRPGLIEVAADCSIPGHPDIFVIGDMARYLHDEKLKPLPGVAPVAVQQGAFVAKVITSRIQKTSPPTFKYKDYGKMATIGRAAAVADLGKNLKFSGFLAWMMWLFIHMMEIVSFRNRLLVLLQWGWHYLSYDRAARLITGDDTHTPLPKTQVAHSETAPTPQPSTALTP